MNELEREKLLSITPAKRTRLYIFPDFRVSVHDSGIFDAG